MGGREWEGGREGGGAHQAAVGDPEGVAVKDQTLVIEGMLKRKREME